MTDLVRRQRAVGQKGIYGEVLAAGMENATGHTGRVWSYWWLAWLSLFGTRAATPTLECFYGSDWMEKRVRLNSLWPVS